MPSSMTFHTRAIGGNAIGSEWIAGEGDIEADTADVLDTFLSSSETSSIYLDSPGGDFFGGIRLGELIRERGLSTSVGKTIRDGRWWTTTKGVCASAASLAFIGGVTRWVNAGEVGVHQFYDPHAWAAPNHQKFTVQDLSNEQKTAGYLVEYVHRMGVDTRFVSFGSSMRPHEMHYFTEEELVELRVRWQPKEFAPWRIEPKGLGVVAISETRDGTESAEIFVRDGMARVVLGCPIYADEEWMSSALQVIQTVRVFASVVPLSSCRYEPVRSMVEIELQRFPLADVEASPHIAVFSEDAPRFAWAAFQFDLPRKHAVEFIRVALRNPIDGSSPVSGV